MEYGIKFRPIKPRSPHLNGKVERSHKTDLEEFYPTVDLRGPALADRLSEWQHYYNWERPHGALLGKSPIDRVVQVSSKVLFWDDVDRMFDPTKERIQEQNYQHELRARKLKRSV